MPYKESKTENNKPAKVQNPTLDPSFNYWRLTAQYALDQYTFAIGWATDKSNKKWLEQYNNSQPEDTADVFGEVFTHYIRIWQNILEDFTVLSFKTLTEYWKNMFNPSAINSLQGFNETQNKLAEDWIANWLKK